MGQVITVISGKGGTGKTTVCAGVAACLAADGQRTLCIDGDIGLRNLDISLGMADLAAISFTDVLCGRYSLSEATPHETIPNLSLLTAPVTDTARLIDEAAFGKLLDRARKEFDYILIDAPAGIGRGFRLATRFADRLLAVSTPDPASMRDAAAATDQLSVMGKEDVRLVVNRVTPRLFRQMRLTVDDVMDGVGLPLIGVIPEDEKVVLAAASHTPLVIYTNQGAAVACLHIARRLQGIKTPLMKLR